MSSFRILGPVEAAVDDAGLPLGGGRQLKLLAFLLLRANRAVSTDVLIDELWGPVRGSTDNRLTTAIARLRKALEPLGERGESRLRTVSGGYLLTVESGELDAEVFARMVEDGQRALDAADPARASELLSAALGLWRGPPLAEVAFEDFARSEIRRLEELRLGALEARNDAELQLGRHVRLLAELESLVASEPTRERLVGQLMLALYRSGRQADALAVYQRARTRLADELGLEPGPALRALQAQILEQAQSLALTEEGAGAAESLARLRAAPLPVPLTPTIGRRQEVEKVRRLLTGSAVRLVTVTGPGGVGKTRLALAIARSMEAAFPDSVCWVELVSVARPQDVESTVARGLGVTLLSGESSRDAVLRVLAEKPTLLVLDNFEHVLEAAGFVADLLSACSELVVLATSREALALSAEHRFVVEPLALPRVPAEATVAEIQATDATALFLAAARRHDSRFEVFPATAPAVARVCARLEGLPLALELAAARTTSLSVEELDARLDRSRTDLGAGPRDFPDRQRTLAATIDWSYRLLDAPLRTAFARFSIFAGGGTLTSAQAVTGARAEAFEALLSKSLIDRRQQPDGGTRLAMLETVREYALQRLAEDPAEERAVRRRHADHYLRLVERTVPQLSTDEGASALGVLERDIDNVRVGVRWAQRAAPAVALRIVDAVDENWWIVGETAEAKDLLECALGKLDPGSELHRYARLLAQLCRVQWLAGDEEQGVETAQHALAMLPDGEPSPERAKLLSWLARTQLLRGRFRGAAEDADEAVAVAVAAQDRRSQSEALQTLAMAQLAAGQVEEGAARVRAVLELIRQDDDLYGLGYASANLADALHLAGRTQPALEVATQGLTAIPERLTAAHEWLLFTVSELSFEAGDWETARTSLSKAPPHQVGNALIYRRLCEAQLALGTGDLDRAAGRLREIEQLVASSHQPQWIGALGALLAELHLRRDDQWGARTVVSKTLDRLKMHGEDVMRIARVSAIGARVEAELAQHARDQRDIDTERDAIRRAHVHLGGVRQAARTGGPVERAWQAVAAAELARAGGRSDAAQWQRAAQNWDALGRSYQACIARWRESEALVQAGDHRAATDAARTALTTAHNLGSGWIVEAIGRLAREAALELASPASAWSPGTVSPGGEIVPLPVRTRRPRS